MIFFINREHAGKKLAEKLGIELTKKFGITRGDKDTIVLGLPRGGVVVAAEVAAALDLPLDILLVRKLGVPWEEEVAMGSIAEGGAQIFNRDIIRKFKITQPRINTAILKEEQELNRQGLLYRGGRPPPDVKGMTVILVDDGVATGAGMLSAIQAVRAQDATRIVVAAPVAPNNRKLFRALKRVADQTVFREIILDFNGVGQSYWDFRQTEDKEVIARLAEAKKPINNHPKLWPLRHHP